MEEDARKGMDRPVKVSEKLMHDIQMLVSRLVEKAHQLLGNFTTNLAESWMHISSKFDGGKVINQSQRYCSWFATKFGKSMGTYSLERYD